MEGLGGRWGEGAGSRGEKPFQHDENMENTQWKAIN